MKKKVLVTIVMTAMMLSTNAITYAKLNEMGIVVNNKIVHLNDATGRPFVQDNRTFVPVRVATENMGAKVEWSNSDKSFTIELDGKVIKGYANKSTVTVDGVAKQIDTSPNVVVKQVASRLYVPIRFVSENLNGTVEYKNRTVYITTDGVQVEAPTYSTITLDKNYSDFNDSDKALEYISKETGWKLYKGITATQIDDATHMLMVTNTYDSIATFTMREWNTSGAETGKVLDDFKRAESTMKNTKELLEFYLGEQDGTDAYNLVNKCINNNKGFHGTAENGMKVSLTANGAGYCIIIK